MRLSLILVPLLHRETRGARRHRHCLSTLVTPTNHPRDYGLHPRGARCDNTVSDIKIVLPLSHLHDLSFDEINLGELPRDPRSLKGQDPLRRRDPLELTKEGPGFFFSDAVSTITPILPPSPSIAAHRRPFCLGVEMLRR